MRTRQYEQEAASKNSSEVLIAALDALGLPWDDAPCEADAARITGWICDNADDDDVSETDDGRRFVYWGDERFYL